MEFTADFQPPNPYQRNGKWYWYDETGGESKPYKTARAALKDLMGYCYYLENGPTLWQRVWWLVKSKIPFLGILILGILTGPATGAERVIASTYGDAKDVRRTGETRVATGARLDANGMFAAHKFFPFGTKLTLTHGHRQAVVTINDRGPFIRGRTLDLTPAVNKQLWCGGLCRLKMEPWPPLPRPAPDRPIQVFAWGEEGED